LSLAAQLDSLTAKLRAMVPAERLATVDRAADELVNADLAAHALQPGDKAPLFELPDEPKLRYPPPDDPAKKDDEDFAFTAS